ncbi:unnamed protein product [Rotaria sp. Silwood2]|nr:unnamed protein product [Rotaria sp. Silwood2]
MDCKSVLPSNIMSLRDDDFIDFVKEEAGHAAAALLELLGINSVKSLLMTDDVYSIMNVKSKSLDTFKNKCGYMQDDGTFKSSKCNQLSSSLTITTDTSSTIRKSTSSVVSDSSPKTIPSKSFNLSVAEHKSYIIDTLNNWCKNNKSKDTNERFYLVEGKDYFISLPNDSSVFRRGKFQLSNLYRHLQGLTNECPALKKKINNPLVTSPSSPNNQQPLTPSNNVLQQIASPNPITNIPASDTIQSNSTSVTASSISKSTEDDENCNKNCDKNIIEQSLFKTKRQSPAECFRYFNYNKRETRCQITTLHFRLILITIEHVTIDTISRLLKSNSSIHDWASRLPVILSCYEARDIFDTDDTDLFYQAIPDRSFVLSKEDCKGEKKSMERLTILLTKLTILNTCRVAGFGKPTYTSSSMDTNDAITEPELQLINNDDPLQQLDIFISSYSD